MKLGELPMKQGVKPPLKPGMKPPMKPASKKNPETGYETSGPLQWYETAYETTSETGYANQLQGTPSETA